MESFGFVAVTIISLCTCLQSCQGASWSYTGEYGADNWAEKFPQYCNGQRQSPIDLKATSTLHDKELDDFVFEGFDSTNGVSWQLSNNGHSVVVTFTSGQLKVSGGSLGGEYRVAQFHFHWGSDNTKGSEHLVDGNMYPMEVHIVCFNTKYSDLGSALTKDDGLAVLGFFFEISDNANPQIQKLVDNFADVKYAGNVTTMTPFPLDDLMAGVSEFYRYPGGLTTPSCNEVVTWTVFKSTIKISNTQIQMFRGLKDSDMASMVNNYRPVQGLFSRTIRANFYDANFISASAGLVVNSIVVVTSVVLSLWFRL
ncbi:carbonic anhydrase 2-like [Babylonia areolata]|uniref:carbonic anhydrase 2-like n=1 Tax=Babylonia areolata TaxID=304850 RepID=UPI003FD0F90F